MVERSGAWVREKQEARRESKQSLKTGPGRQEAVAKGIERSAERRANPIRIVPRCEGSTTTWSRAVQK